MSGRLFSKFKAVALASTASVALVACDETGQFQMPSFGGSGQIEAEQPVASVQLVERDVEAPDVFQVTDEGLWDGRPSLGGVWVAHPDVKEPERVIIRNQSNGKFVIGALFRRERNNPGPVVQTSSDAAAALGMLAGSPATLQITALRREEAPAEPEAVAVFDEPTDIQATPLDDVDPIATATAAIEAAESAAAPAPTPAPTPAASKLTKPYIQLGIFSVEDNANRTAERMRSNGIVPTVLEQSSQGRTFWRVIVGPATSESERADLLTRVKAQGFDDAYFVTN